MGLLSIKNVTSNKDASRFACIAYINISQTTFDILTRYPPPAYWPVSQSVLARPRIINTLASVQRQLRHLLHLLYNERQAAPQHPEAGAECFSQPCGSSARSTEYNYSRR